MTREDNGAAAVMDVLRQSGCDEIKIVQVIDRESGVIGWYGIEERTGRVFDLIAYPVPQAREIAPESLARAVFAAYQDWIEAGRPKWWVKMQGRQGR